MSVAIFFQFLTGLILIGSSLGMILVKKPVHASLCFLLTLLSLAVLYLQLSAQFIAVMQILVYAGAILVIFMFVIVLFQDAYLLIAKTEGESPPWLIGGAIAAVLGLLALVAPKILSIKDNTPVNPDEFGTVRELGHLLYLDFFFPFEAVILLFVVALIGTVYIGKRVIDG